MTGKPASEFTEMISAAVDQLAGFVNSALTRPMETTRIARALVSLLLAGVSARAELLCRIIGCIVQGRHTDGGWSDPEETAWAAGAIGLVRGEEDDAFKSAKSWLNAARRSGGGWGHHSRDHARIPITSLICALVPEVVKAEDRDWLTKEWQRDFESEVRLSYKAGFFLLAMAQRQENDLVVRTISHLSKDHNDDGGFGPWKGHPIGSDPWSTGVVLWGLSKWIHHVDTAVVEKALAWLRDTQLPSGYWPYHYLDEGTSLALIGAVSAMKALATKE